MYKLSKSLKFFEVSLQSLYWIVALSMLVVASIELNFVYLLSIRLLWTKWWNFRIASGSNMSDMWLFKYYLQGSSAFLKYCTFYKECSIKCIKCNWGCVKGRRVSCFYDSQKDKVASLESKKLHFSAVLYIGSTYLF